MKGIFNKDKDKVKVEILIPNDFKRELDKISVMMGKPVRVFVEQLVWAGWSVFCKYMSDSGTMEISFKRIENNN